MVSLVEWLFSRRIFEPRDGKDKSEPSNFYGSRALFARAQSVWAIQNSCPPQVWVILEERPRLEEFTNTMSFEAHLGFTYSVTLVAPEPCLVGSPRWVTGTRGIFRIVISILLEAWGFVSVGIESNFTRWRAHCKRTQYGEASRVSPFAPLYIPPLIPRKGMPFLLL